MHVLIPCAGHVLSFPLHPFQVFCAKPAQSHCTSTLQVPPIILPHVIMWEPMSQFSLFFRQGITCPTSGCSHAIHLSRWNTGSSAGHCPRLLHDIEHMIILVPAVYCCTRGHAVLSTDERILQCFI